MPTPEPSDKQHIYWVIIYIGISIAIALGVPLGVMGFFTYHALH